MLEGAVRLGPARSIGYFGHARVSTESHASVRTNAVVLTRVGAGEVIERAQLHRNEYSKISGGRPVIRHTLVGEYILQYLSVNSGT